MYIETTGKKKRRIDINENNQLESTHLASILIKFYRMYTSFRIYFKHIYFKHIYVFKIESLFFSFFIFLIKFSWRRNLHNLCRPKILKSVFHLIVITCFVGLIWKWYCLVTFIYFICFTCRPKYQVFFFLFLSLFCVCLFVLF